ncbi:MAG: PQQ-binding-like beta-propeller repeat protein [Gemmatimonadota bacterium]
MALTGTVNAACINYHPGPVAVPAEQTAGAPAQIWTSHAGRTIGAPVAVQDGMIYAAGVDRVVHAITLDSGRVRWGFRLTGTLLSGVVRADSSVYAASARPIGHVVALSAATGRKWWSADVGEVAAPLSLVGGFLLVPTRKGELVALEPATGKLRWRRRIGVARSSAVPAGDRIVVASLDSIYLMSPADGSILQRRPMRGVVLGGWRESGDLLIGATTDSTIVALRISDLSRVWTARLDAPAFTAPALRGDTAFVMTRIGSLYRVAISSGAAEQFATLAWPATAGPTLYQDGFLVGGADGTVRGLDGDGRELWRIAVWRPVDVAPILLDDGFLVIGGNGDFHRYAR